jgi:DNA-binding MltR family transcriptional regulator
MRTEDINYYSEFLKEFQKESDRGAALVGAALLDDKLASTLLSFFKKTKESRELLDVNSPLGSFNARIKVTYCIGLINEFEYREMETIRKIRNEFAHQLHGISFQTPKITALCKNLRSDTPGDISGNPRFQFINAVICTSLGLFYRPELIEVNKKVKI